MVSAEPKIRFLSPGWQQLEKSPAFTWRWENSADGVLAAGSWPRAPHPIGTGTCGCPRPHVPSCGGAAGFFFVRITIATFPARFLCFGKGRYIPPTPEPRTIGSFVSAPCNSPKSRNSQKRRCIKGDRALLCSETMVMSTQ